MSKASQDMRSAVDHSLDALAMISFNDGFEAAINAIEEFSNEAHNTGKKETAEILLIVAKALRGEDV